MWVLSLEWKKEEVMDGVMVVTDDERGWQMRQEDYSKDWVMHNGKSDLWFWERKMRVDERWW